jgi:hypothetical protein
MILLKNTMPIMNVEKENPLTEEQIKSGVNLGYLILQWVVYNRPELTGGEARSAILTLIGPECDASLQDSLNQLRQLNMCNPEPQKCPVPSFGFNSD